MENIQENKTITNCKECEHCIRNGGEYFESYHCDLGGFTYRRGSSLLLESECSIRLNDNRNRHSDDDDDLKLKHKKSHNFRNKFLNALGLFTSEE